MYNNCAFYFFNDTATTEIYTLSLHDALPICLRGIEIDIDQPAARFAQQQPDVRRPVPEVLRQVSRFEAQVLPVDRKSTRLNSSHANISYAVFCLKKK